MNRKIFLFLPVILFSVLSLNGQQTQTRSASASEYYEQARKAYEEKNYASYVENLQHVIEAGTRHPVVFYSLAGGYALLGKQKESLDWLNRIADLGVVYPVSEDADFASIRETEEYGRLLLRFQQNLNPTDHSTIGFTIAEDKFLAEGVAYDAVEKVFYTGSILKKKIVKTDQNGKITDFSSPNDELLSVLGMSVDPTRRVLWVSAASFPELGDSKKNESAIFKYNLQNGKLNGRYPLNTNKEGNQLGDVIVSSGGDVFTTDSFSPAVYWIPRDKNKIELLIGGDVFRSPQGLCLSPDEKVLFVADYVRGIFAIDLKNRSHQKLSSPETATVVGIDGLYFYKDSLIATQNGVKPNRVLRLMLNKDRTGIEDVKVLESSHKLFGEITLGTIARDSLYYVGNSQFGDYLNDPKINVNFPIILKLALDSK